MTGRQFGGHRSFDDLERVALGGYRRAQAGRSSEPSKAAAQ
ncbi:MAG: hypothetical protein ACRDZ7_19345 [Acidimicrobiia bacterium]